MATSRAGSAAFSLLGLKIAARSGSMAPKSNVVLASPASSTASSTTTPLLHPSLGPDLDSAARTSLLRSDIDISSADDSCASDTLFLRVLALGFGERLECECETVLVSSRSGRCFEMPDVSASRMVDSSVTACTAGLAATEQGECAVAEEAANTCLGVLWDSLACETTARTPTAAGAR